MSEVQTTTYVCRCCATTVHGWTNGAVLEPGWYVIEGIDGPDTLCPECVSGARLPIDEFPEARLGPERPVPPIRGILLVPPDPDPHELLRVRQPNVLKWAPPYVSIDTRSGRWVDYLSSPEALPLWWDYCPVLPSWDYARRIVRSDWSRLGDWVPSALVAAYAVCEVWKPTFRQVLALANGLHAVGRGTVVVLADPPSDRRWAAPRVADILNCTIGYTVLGPNDVWPPGGECALCRLYQTEVVAYITCSAPLWQPERSNGQFPRYPCEPAPESIPQPVPVEP